MDNVKRENRELDLFEIFQMLLRHWWIIILSVLISGILTYTYSKVAITPQYTSITKIYISNVLTDSQSNPTPPTEILKDYEELVKSRAVLEKIINKYNLNDNYASLSNRVNAKNSEETQIITISVTDSNPKLAQQLADSIRNESIKHAVKVMKVISVGVVDKADYPKSQSYPNTMRWLEYGMLVGFILSVVLLFVRYILDDTIKTSEDVEKYLGLSTLAEIPKINNIENKKKENITSNKRNKRRRRKRV